MNYQNNLIRFTNQNKRVFKRSNAFLMKSNIIYQLENKNRLKRKFDKNNYTMTISEIYKVQEGHDDEISQMWKQLLAEHYPIGKEFEYNGRYMKVTGFKTYTAIPSVECEEIKRIDFSIPFYDLPELKEQAKEAYKNINY